MMRAPNLKGPAVFVLSILLFFAFSLNAYAGEPTQQVQQTVDRLIEILKNKELKKTSRAEERRAAIRKVVSERFDFEEMAKRSLAIHWQKRSSGERTEFVPLYTDLLERSYINKIEGYEDEKILYAGEELNGQYSVVKSKVLSKRNVETPIEYKLLSRDGRWQVYDVVIEGVSLVNNYRTQFNRIITKESYDALVKRMKNKQEDLDKVEKK
ncbi:MAG: ABC transporter substrate-binding protein [Nitrospirales bacterium]|nr:ABC transporter substrate-binding protein [Nitrospirales bacterium]